MLIRDAELYPRGERWDVRLREDIIAEIGRLRPSPGEPALDARGNALLPGLHDHHIHLMSYAASLDSVPCGPPEVTDPASLKSVLRSHESLDPRGWVRGIGYHESVAGDIDRTWLDRNGPDRPVRIQHRSGRLWILNSQALNELKRAADGPTVLPADGRLYDADVALRRLLGATLPPVAEASRRLARWGVTGLTDMTPHNDDAAVATFRALRADGSLLQRLRVAGCDRLTSSDRQGVDTGETKFHLHEADLPALDDFVAGIRASHRRDRAIAVHCVTRLELVFTLAALREAGTLAGDRVEHASVTPPELMVELYRLGLVVVTQPNFVAERGDAYLDDVEDDDRPWLYRCRGFLDAGVPLAAGTDAPFGAADPWAAMQAAVQRCTAWGRILGKRERLTPEQALALFIGEPGCPHRPRRIEVGAPADLCLLTVPWADARERLSGSMVKATIVGGECVWQHGEGTGSR